MRIAVVLMALIGAALLVVAIVIAAAVPGLKRVPADYKQTVDIEGTYSVVADQDFLIQLLSNPGFQRLLASPATLQVLGNPATGQFLASDALKALLANPATLQTVLTNPQAAAQASPQVAQVLANPAAQALLGEPVIRGILSDPVGGPLLLDARTLRLLADPAHPQLQDIPVRFHRVRTAESSEGDTLVIHQDFDAFVRGANQPLPQLSSKNTLVVDRKTRYYLPGGSEPRIGAWSFPFDTQKESNYSLWITEVYQPLTATFEKESELNGLKLYDFRVKASGIPLNDAAKKDNGLPTSLDLKAQANLLYHVEPATGIPVSVESTITYTLDNPVLGNPPVFIGKTADSAASVAEAVDDAKGIKALLTWVGGVVPAVAAALGSLLFLDAFLLPPKPTPATEPPTPAPANRIR